MPTRRRFIVAALAFSAVAAAARSRALGAATPTPPPKVPLPTPTPAPTASPPSKSARVIAGLLRDDFPDAHLTPGEVEKIAEDVDGITPLSKYYRGIHLRNSDEPDVVFFS